MRILRGAVRLCAGLGVLLLVGSYLGALHPAGDSLAVFRGWIAGGVLASGLVLLLLRDRGWAVYFVALACIGAISPVGSRLMGAAEAGADPGGYTYSLYQKNLLFLANDAAAILAEIERLEPDFLTLQEVSAANRAQIFDRLPDVYDREICAYAGVGSVAVASRHPFVPGSRLCIERLGMIAVQVDAPDGPVWLASVHLHWPWPFGQVAQVDQILPLLARIDGPLLIGGDFNMVRWSHTMREVQRVTGSSLLTQGQPTLALTWNGMRGPGFEIDHILAPTSGAPVVERLEFLGSDHRGLLARFDL